MYSAIKAMINGTIDEAIQSVLKNVKIVNDLLPIAHKKGENQNQQDIDTINCERFVITAKLLIYNQKLGGAIEACNSLGMLYEESKQSVLFHNLKALHAKIHRGSHILISEVPIVMNEFKGLLCGLEAAHLEFLSELKCSMGLVNFINSNGSNLKFNEWLDRCLQCSISNDLLTIDLQTKFVMVYHFLKDLKILLRLSEESYSWRWEDITGFLVQSLPTETYILRMRSALLSVCECVEKFQLALSNVSCNDDMLNTLTFLRTYLSLGVFESDLSAGILFLRFPTENNQLEYVPFERLEELLQSVTLRFSTSLNSEYCSTIKCFGEFCHNAQTVHAKVLSARNQKIPFFMELSLYEHPHGNSEIDTIELIIETWNNMLNTETSHRLRFLTCNQLYLCLFQLATSKSYLSLLPYFLLCFPDSTVNLIVTNETLCTALGTMSDLDETCKTRDPLFYSSLLSVVSIALVRCTLSMVEKGYIVELNNSSSLSKRGNPQAILCGEGYDTIYAHILSINCVTPLPNQLLWCSGDTTLTDLLDLISCAKLWSNIKFSLINVNFLVAELQRMLLDTLQRTDQSLGDNIFLLFSQLAGIEKFSAFWDRTCENDRDVICRNMFRSSLHSDAIRKVEFVTGNASTGKSTFIMQQLRVKVDRKSVV